MEDDAAELSEKVDQQLSQVDDQHAGTRFPRTKCRHHPGCRFRYTCFYSHGLVQRATENLQVSAPRTCFLGQAPHNQGCHRPTYNGEPFEFCSTACREKAKITPKGPLGCRRQSCPCPVTMSGIGGQFCCAECAKGTPCRRVTHTLPTVHLVVVAKPQPGKYAPCARADCACAVEDGSSWNGEPGEYCCRACRNGTPCQLLWHTVPESIAAANSQAKDSCFECALDGCSRSTWNGREGEYCCLSHRQMGLGNAVALTPSEASLPAEPEPPRFPDYGELRKNAESWARAHGRGAKKGYISGVWGNASLDCEECPARVSFERAVDRAGLDNWADGEFGWHGTSSMDAVQGICWTNWDPKRRSGQAFGPGEYFSRGTQDGLHYSEGYAGGDAGHLLIVGWIMSHDKGAAPKDPRKNGACGASSFFTPSGHIVCNNPASGHEMYCIPAAVVAFGTGKSKPFFRIDSAGKLAPHPSGHIIPRRSSSICCVL